MGLLYVNIVCIHEFAISAAMVWCVYKPLLYIFIVLGEQYDGTALPDTVMADKVNKLTTRCDQLEQELRKVSTSMYLILLFACLHSA